MALAAASSLHAGTTIVYAEDFASCGAAGFSITGLWHPTTLGACSAGHPGCGLYFGLDASCTYANGSTVTGNAISPLIDLTEASAPITLRFAYRAETELAPCSYDRIQVRVSDDGFATSALVADNGCSAPTTLVDGGGWSMASIDLSAWAGSTVQVRFAFDSVDSVANGAFGFAVTDLSVEAAATTPPNALTLEAPPCPDDAFPGVPGHQIAVELWMRDLAPPGATGFQAFVEFDAALLGFRDDLSSYPASPFPLHLVQFGAAPPAQVEWAPGRLRLDGSSAPFTAPAGADAVLATLVFDALDDCDATSLAFGGYPAPPAFLSELSLLGSPLATEVVPSGPVSLDDAAPTIACPPDITVAADVSVPLCIGSDCCTSHPGVGCSDAGCTSTVCLADAFCCNVTWDGICASEAGDLCGDAVAPCLGATVRFSVGANDGCAGGTTVECVPPSGSFFPIGTTTVQCTATDACGNEATCAFDVHVTPTNLVLVDVQAVVGSFTAPAATRCIRFQTASCPDAVDQGVTFASDGIGHQTSGPILVEIPCGDWSTLCVKDEQHTTWCTVPLASDGAQWIATTPATLLPGDTDNDGDVDINDVTWLVFTYAMPAGPDPCPFDFPGPGPRDADFSLNGAVSAEDYSLLTDQYLTSTSCPCSMPSAEDPNGEAPSRLDRRRSVPANELDPRVRSRVDLNHDGRFDADDVRLLESDLGLAPSLSERMRTAVVPTPSPQPSAPPRSDAGRASHAAPKAPGP